MDRRKLYFILVCIVAGFGLAAFWTGFRRTAARSTGNVMPTDTQITIDKRTDIPPADPAIVGHWISSDKPGWHKVYYDDYDENQQLFWGKEWDEADDVHEYDLLFHGNGWFRWQRYGNLIREYATMDNQDIPIHHAFVIEVSFPDSLVYHDHQYKRIVYHFSREK